MARATAVMKALRKLLSSKNLSDVGYGIDRSARSAPGEIGNFPPRPPAQSGGLGNADPISAVAPESEMAGAGLSKAMPRSIGGQAAPPSPQGQQKVDALSDALGGRPFTQQDYDMVQGDLGFLLNDAENAAFNKMLRQMPDGTFIIGNRGMSVE